MSYSLLKDIDPNESSKRKLVVTSVYDPPLLVKKNYGTRGKYADFLRPLLLQKSDFHGKMYELCNSLGLFEEYYKEFISENSSAMDMVQRNGDFSYNLWKFRE